MGSDKRSGLPYPMSLMLLDIIGAGLIGVGLYEWHAGPEFMPMAWRFEHYHFAMIVAGFLLMLPLFLYFIRMVRTRRV